MTDSGTTMREIAIRDAIREAMSEEMRRDPRVLLIGEEVGAYNGAYKASRGMLDEFGPKRVVDAPIAENGFAGLGIGAAMAGLRPIVEFMTYNFSLIAIDQILNTAAKARLMSAGQIKLPIVFRGAGGAAYQLGAQHANSFEQFYAYTPGLIVIAPATPYDMKGLLKSAIRNDNPVCFFESELTYGVKGPVPEEEYVLPIGKADIKREGKDITLITWSKNVIVAAVLAAAIALFMLSSRRQARTFSAVQQETVEERGSENIKKRVQRELAPSPVPPQSSRPLHVEDADDEEEEDSELMPAWELTPAFSSVTPISNAGKGPVAVVVTPKGARATPALSNEKRESEDEGAAPKKIMDALTELQRAQGHSSLIGGARVGQGSRIESKGEEEEQEDSDDETDSELTQKFAGQARGYAILPLMLLRARESVEKQVDAMLRSKVQTLYLSFLADKVFDFDIEYASSVVQRLTAEGRSLTLEAYFTSGPTMRRYDTTPISTPFTLDPYVFRYLIAEDEEFQSKYRQFVETVRPLFVQNKNGGAQNKNIACVMLEDNLDRESYKKMRDETKEVLGDLVSFIRNPCPKCGIDGSDSDSAGDGLEYHAPEYLPDLDERGGITLDGTGYNYPGETDAGRVSFDQMKAFLSNASAKGIRFVGLWRADRQGLGPGRGDQLVPPDRRSYAVPTDQQIQWDIELLRAGLNPVQ